jgi:hypothetical protein
MVSVFLTVHVFSTIVITFLSTPESGMDALCLPEGGSNSFTLAPAGMWLTYARYTH